MCPRRRRRAATAHALAALLLSPGRGAPMTLLVSVVGLAIAFYLGDRLVERLFP
jgi:hypothetical protein